jgi:hypothetical protein
VIRDRIGRTALRAYPPAVRQARGLEMLGMLLDAAEQSNLAFVRESGSLVLGGLRERKALIARAGTRRLVADACCQAVLIFLMLWLISAVKTQVITGTTGQILIQEVVLAAILACGLFGYQRAAAIGGLAALIAYGPLGPHVELVRLARLVVPITCLLVMVRAPQRRPRDPRRLLWLVSAPALAALMAHVQVGVPAVLAVISVGALLQLLHDPRPAIACSLVWITVLSAYAGRGPLAGPGSPMVLAVGVVRLMLMIAAGRLWIMRPRATRY